MKHQNQYHKDTEYRKIRFKIIHHETFNHKEESWNYRNKEMYIDITRPEKGVLTLNNKCAYCDKLFKIEIDSFEIIESNRISYDQKTIKRKRIRFALLPFLCISILCFAISIFVTAKDDWFFFGVTLLLFAGIPFFIYCFDTGEPGSIFDRGFRLKEGLKMDPLPGFGQPPSYGVSKCAEHFVANVITSITDSRMFGVDVVTPPPNCNFVNFLKNIFNLRKSKYPNSEDNKPVEKVSCKNCGAMILPATSKSNKGLCAPCKSGGYDRRSNIQIQNSNTDDPFSSPKTSIILEYNSGNNALKNNDIKGAIVKYQNAIKTWESSSQNERECIEKEVIIRLFINLCNSLFRIGKSTEALAALNKAILFHPDHILAIYNKAWILDKLGNAKEAVELWQKYIKLAENNPMERDSLEYAKNRLVVYGC